EVAEFEGTPIRAVPAANVQLECGIEAANRCSTVEIVDDEGAPDLVNYRRGQFKAAAVADAAGGHVVSRVRSVSEQIPADKWRGRIEVVGICCRLGARRGECERDDSGKQPC